MNLPDVFAAEIVGKLDVHEGLTHAAIRATLTLAESHLAGGAPASALQHELALEHSAPALRLDGLRAAVGFFSMARRGRHAMYVGLRQGRVRVRGWVLGPHRVRRGREAWVGEGASRVAVFIWMSS